MHRNNLPVPGVSGRDPGIPAVVFAGMFRRLFLYNMQKDVPTVRASVIPGALLLFFLKEIHQEQQIA